MTAAHNYEWRTFKRRGRWWAEVRDTAQCRTVGVRSATTEASAKAEVRSIIREAKAVEATPWRPERDLRA